MECGLAFLVTKHHISTLEEKLKSCDTSRTYVPSTTECILDNKETHFSSQYLGLGHPTSLLQRGALGLQEIYVFLFSG